ncbi:putative acetyl-coenzyme A carboxylase carboxyl transferase subunit alpha, chloroplastic-like [Capsicum annuum]|uniref:OVARIAN TUMOR DOMAIN-containing deubiquitinating enzyme 3 isoform X1 n=1 Tax=Capsicum annuum TaxID=4072 RepID=UPI0007BEC741|nr:OVARIAN TUMOR DOMAIN-containing deubiquitinating enzyme 3 isoform X1 [Capsicum annuum]KAF3624474.1 putative acetyl-coenzyme A carboxylase carboxyl transferase subunit alpha, chloroplastic-like [Capsicum annuum]
MAAVPPSNDVVLEELRDGLAQFELATSPVASVSASSYRPHQTGNAFAVLSGATGYHVFARIGPSLGGASPALKKAERYSVQKITGDGRCMFRALVKGMAFNKGVKLHPRDERDDADELRMAVKEAICDDEKERLKYEEALVAITVEESLRRYCQRIGRSDFWGGESELLVLSKLCCQPVMVYIPEQEHGGRGSGFIPIAEYGAEFRKGSKNRKARKVVRLLYSGRNHYDLLV